MIAIPLSGVLGGPISGALLGLHGQLGLAGWQWLFLLEGLPAVLLGLVVLERLPDGPDDVDWLTAEEREWVAARLAAERETSAGRHPAGVWRALGSATVWQLGILLFLCNAFGVYVLGLWLPQIVREVTGLGNLGVGVVSAVPNLVAAVAMILVGASSDRSGERLLYVAGSAAVAAAGFLASARLHSPVGVVLALSVAAAGLLSSHGPFWPLPSSFLSGSAAAGGIALIVSIANVAGFLGPYATGVLRGVSGSYGPGLVALGLVSLAGAGLALWLRQAPRLAPLGSAEREYAAPATDPG
jgi:ACS family tartrate transporter-like MFS transporter